jgi:hypothetical protein
MRGQLCEFNKLKLLNRSYSTEFMLPKKLAIPPYLKLKLNLTCPKIILVCHRDGEVGPKSHCTKVLFG